MVAIAALLFMGSSPHEQSAGKAPIAGSLLAADFSLVEFSAVQDTLPRRRQVRQPSRRARAAQLRGGGVDTSGTRRITKTLLDSIRAIPRDSSARLAQFQHLRKDIPQAEPVIPTTSPMFLDAPSLVRVQHMLDSLQWVYYIRETVNNEDVKIPQEIPFEEYTKLRLRSAVRKNWEILAQRYEFEGEKKQGLSDVFGKITTLEIPVPKNPLFSIFGPNRIRLNINGSVDIHAGLRNTKSDQFQLNPLAQERNEPDFAQELQVNVKGEIGDKLTIDADWNTSREFEYENQVKVRYKGYEDDIVQSVEAGNVSLATKSSFISSNQALFGVKAAFQLGPLTLTTLASQKKGQIKEFEISGGTQAKPFERRATDYVKDQHFFVDSAYTLLFDRIFGEIPANPDLSQQIRDIEVWVSRTSTQDPTDREVVAFIDRELVERYQTDLDARSGDFGDVEKKGEVEVGFFYKLNYPEDYRYDESAGFITLNHQIQHDQAIAVAYTLPGPGLQGTIDIGNFGAKDTAKTLKLVMKLVRPRKLDPSFKRAWPLMLKNIYPLGGVGIKKEGFELNVYYEPPGRPEDDQIDGFNLLEVLGLDRFGEEPGSDSDNKFDYYPNITVNELRGELIFPTLEPFRDGIRRFYLDHKMTIAQADSFTFGDIYDTTYTAALYNTRKNRFVIKGQTTASVASSYNLGFGNLVEGSVKVLVDGVEAVPGADYTVDYITGQLVIRNQSLLVPGRNVRISYEANDLFQLASKSLLGARGDLALSKSTALGFTVMNLNQQTLNDKVRIGEEPISNTILGVDGGTSANLDFLTRAMNALPGIQTNAPSSFSLKGEAAYMLPDPNTRKSTIPQDGGSGIAFIDDFEGTRKTVYLGTEFSRWFDASPPFYMSQLDAYVPDPDDPRVPTNDPIVLAQLLPDSSKMEYKARLTWFNIIPGDVDITDLRPEKSVRSGGEQVRVLDLYYEPRQRGAYNYSLDLDTKLRPNPTQTWAGMMRVLGTTGTNLIEENINYIEFWVKIGVAEPTVKLHIDLGQISEDVIPNRELDTEDGLGDPLRRNGRLNTDEDVGLDALTNEQERIEFAEFLVAHPEYASDPSGDDWVQPFTNSINPIPQDYIGLNGTEGNSKGPAGQFPDTEDLNNNSILDRTNSYFEYVIPMDTTNPDFRKYIAGGGANQWHQIRIPLNEFTTMIGEPTLTVVEAVRVWIEGAQDSVFLRLAEFNLVGSNWEERIKNDPTFRVTERSVEDNPGFYDPPPGVVRARDRSRPDEQILLNEQSLAFVINGLGDGDSREAIKRFARPMDMFNYSTLKMFIHGENRPGQTFAYVNLDDYDAEIYLRFGADTLNYYEYRAPVHPGWVGNDITIRFEELTAIKLGRDSAATVNISPPVPVPNGSPGAVYRVRGSPTLTTIRFITIGVENPASKGAAFLNGELWINEMRVTDVDDTPGWAYRFDTSIKFADVASVSFALTERDPFFHGLEDRFGSRNTDRNWNLAANVGFEKFLPASWRGSNLAFSYSHTEAMQRPRYLPGTDIVVDEAVELVQQQNGSNGAANQEANDIRLRSQTLVVTENYALPNVKIVLPSESWWVTKTINSLTFGFTYNTSTRRNPQTLYYRQWGWNSRLAYAADYGDNYVEPFSVLGDFFLFSPWKKVRLYYAPKSIGTSAVLNRSQAYEHTRLQALPKPTVRNLNATRSFNFNWPIADGGLLNLATDYDLSITSSLLHFELDSLGRQRPFTSILGDIFGGTRLIDFGVTQGYAQTINITPRPTVPPIFELDKIITLNSRYSSRYNWQNNIQAGVLGRSGQWNSSLSTNFDINIKQIGSKIWPDAKPAPSPTDTSTGKGATLGSRLEQLSRLFIKIPFFDFDKFSISFSQNNRSQNSGLVGRTGFNNLFARVPFFQESLPEYGPSLLYQLGLSSDPHGKVLLNGSGRFPFFTATTIPGLRAPNGSMNDIFSQGNRVSMKTSRQLWQGARLELNWSLNWDYNVNKTIRTDAEGRPEVLSRVVGGSIDRSFFTMPPTLFFKFFKTSIEDVNKLYENLKRNSTDTRTEDAKLSQAFEEGLEALPIGKSIFGELLPRPNWSLRWDGLEKLPLFSSLAQRVSFTHSYTSTYRRRWKLSVTTGNEITESQQVVYGFSPLLGFDISFGEVLKGNLSSNIRYGTSTSLDLSPSSLNIVEANTSDIAISATYGRKGFEFPFFGLSLSNDLDITFSYTYSRNTRRVYNFKEDFKKDGTPLEGSSRTTMETRIRYVLSARVTASLFYKYTALKPDEGGSRIPGSTVNDLGLDIRLSIQP